MNEYDDPEASYRRGYQQGACAAASAAETLAMVPGGLERLRQWWAHELFRWRYLDRPNTRKLQPPPPPS